jgi:hypothetical protein
MKNANANIIFVTIAVLVVALCMAISETIAITVLVVALLAAYVYYKNTQYNKQQAEVRATIFNNFMYAIYEILPRIIIDSMRGLESQFGLPSADKLAPTMTHEVKSNGVTVFRLAFTKLPNKERLLIEILKALAKVLNSAVVSCLKQNGYDYPFSEPFISRGYHLLVPCAYVVSVHDTGTKIIVNVILPIDDTCYGKIVQLNNGSEDTPPTPPQADTPYDSDF